MNDLHYLTWEVGGGGWFAQLFALISNNTQDIVVKRCYSFFFTQYSHRVNGTGFLPHYITSVNTI